MSRRFASLAMRVWLRSGAPSSDYASRPGAQSLALLLFEVERLRRATGALPTRPVAESSDLLAVLRRWLEHSDVKGGTPTTDVALREPPRPPRRAPRRWALGPRPRGRLSRPWAGTRAWATTVF
eukprot:9406180-Pyramimonas_sp.AAC.1